MGCVYARRPGLGKQLIVAIIKLLIFERVLLDRLKVDEKRREPTVPIVRLSMILSLICFFDLVMQLLECDHIAEQVLKPGREHITPRVELFIFPQTPHVHL